MVNPDWLIAQWVNQREGCFLLRDQDGLATKWECYKKLHKMKAQVQFPLLMLLHCEIGYFVQVWRQMRYYFGWMEENKIVRPVPDTTDRLNCSSAWLIKNGDFVPTKDRHCLTKISIAGFNSTRSSTGRSSSRTSSGPMLTWKRLQGWHTSLILTLTFYQGSDSAHLKNIVCVIWHHEIFSCWQIADTGAVWRRKCTAWGAAGASL